MGIILYPVIRFIFPVLRIADSFQRIGKRGISVILVPIEGADGASNEIDRILFTEIQCNGCFRIHECVERFTLIQGFDAILYEAGQICFGDLRFCRCLRENDLSGADRSEEPQENTESGENNDEV